MITREKLGVLANVIAIVILWLAIAFVVVMGTAFGDCFEPGCGAEKDRIARIAIPLVAVGFIGHIIAYVWLKARRTRRG